jgi:hypothetical protein
VCLPLIRRSRLARRDHGVVASETLPAIVQAHRDAPKSGELKRQVAFRWSGDEAQARRVQKEQAHHYLRWIFFAAVGAVIASLITEGLALLH